MRIHLVRHGQSESNIGVHDFETAGDHKVCLTEKGVEQAMSAGMRLRSVLRAALPVSDTAEPRTLIYRSPYMRTRQTLHGMLVASQPANKVEKVRVFEDVRLREIERGYGDSEEQQALRPVHGYFYYRYAGGESPADCSDRISNFLESMMRQVNRKRPDDVVIVTHGLAIRCFVMRYMHLTVEQFESLDNPDNCDIITIETPLSTNSKYDFVSGRWGVSGLKFRPEYNKS